MDHFFYKGPEAFCEDVSLSKIALKHGTPSYIYSANAIRQECAEFRKAFASHPTSFCYAVKANSNLSVLKEIFAAGFGADIVSQGELERALLAGADPQRIVYSGVGKKEAEIRRALELGILSFNVESFFELELLAKIASDMKRKAPISLRVNPNIDAKTHPKIATGMHSSKFGIASEDIDAFLQFISANPSCLELIGLGCHIGSQITDLSPIHEASLEMLKLVNKVQKQGFTLRYLNMGGGLGIRYTDEKVPSIADYAKVLLRSLRGRPLQLLLEPGRVLVGNAGILLTRVLGLKHTPQKKFLVVDAAMNDLIRPSLYGAQHEFCVVNRSDDKKTSSYDIVGPICETGDFLGLEVDLPDLKPGDLLYVRSCGAYGFSMSSQYNSRPRAAEVLVDGGACSEVRKREELSDLWMGEL